MHSAGVDDALTTDNDGAIARGVGKGGAGHPLSGGISMEIVRLKFVGNHKQFKDDLRMLQGVLSIVLIRVL